MKRRVVAVIVSRLCHGTILWGSFSTDGTEVMEELSRRELLVLKEIHLTGETSDRELVRKFVEQDMIVDIGSLLLTHKGRGLLVRGSPALWDYVAWYSLRWIYRILFFRISKQWGCELANKVMCVPKTKSEHIGGEDHQGSHAMRRSRSAKQRERLRRLFPVTGAFWFCCNSRHRPPESRATSMALISPASAQMMTRDQCYAFANAIPEVILSLNKMGNVLTNVNLDLINNKLSCRAKSSADSAQHAQRKLSAALRKYTSTLENFNYQMQVCAR
jgi:hypothetical protein